MARHHRKELPALLEAIRQGQAAQVYLLCGERFLCQQAAREIIQALLPDERQRSQALITIDGDQEDPLQTLGLLRTYGLFGGRRVLRVNDSRLLHSRQVTKALWDKAEKAFQAGRRKLAGRRLRAMLAAAGLEAVDGAELAALSPAGWRRRFGFPRPTELAWACGLLATTATDAGSRRPDPAALYLEALTKGLPPATTLLLLTETADRRTKLYKHLEKHGEVLDLAVDQASSASARKEQEALLQELIRSTLAGFGKTLDPQVMPLLLERVGFHPVAAVMETEKLALSVGDAERIGRQELDAVVGRTREEAIFELTEAYGRRDLERSLTVLVRLLRAGVHPLAILASLRNHLRKLLLVRALLSGPEPAYRRGMGYSTFQKGYLPQLKKHLEPWPPLLTGHPYALYQLFRQAEPLPLAGLRRQLTRLAETEYRLKGSWVAAELVLEDFLFSALSGS